MKVVVEKVEAKLRRESRFLPSFRILDAIVLGSLVGRSRYGYEMEAVAVNVSLGRIVGGNATVYKAIQRLEREGNIERMRPMERRVYYGLTEQGRVRLSNDLSFMRWVLQAFDERTL